MDLRWQPVDVDLTATVDVTLKRGNHWFTVHATGWAGNPESSAGRSYFVVR